MSSIYNGSISIHNFDFNYNVLIVGTPNSGKSILEKALAKYFYNNQITKSIRFWEFTLKHLNYELLKKTDLILFVTELNVIKNKREFEHVLNSFNLLSFLVEMIKKRGYDLKLLLIINKCDKLNEYISWNLFGNHKRYRCSALKILVENIIKNRSKMDVHKYRCQVNATLKETNSKKINLDDHDKYYSPIYGDWDWLIDEIIECYENKKIMSKL